MNRVVASSMILAGVALMAFLAPASGRGQDRGPILSQVIREIDDSATGDRWLLVHDANDAGGPGRMVRIANAAVDSATHPVIHAGDTLVVEEHRPVVDARLAATAMGSAAVGAEIEARLKIGGKSVRVVALGPGRAELKPVAKAQR